MAKKTFLSFTRSRERGGQGATRASTTTRCSSPPARSWRTRQLRLAETQTPIQGASDHGTHEAIYLPDPDGNGIELAADRPRERWPRTLEYAGGPHPLDLDGLLATVAGEEPRPVAGPGLAIGHVHLHVGDLERGLGFYRDVLGFELMAFIPGAAAFVAAGGYHHHLGFNVWRGEGVPPAPQGRVGLRHWTVVLDDPDRSTQWMSGSVLPASQPRRASADFSCVTPGRSRCSSSPPRREKRIRLSSRPGFTSSSYGWRCGRVSALALREAVGAPSKNPSEKCEKALTLTLREALGFSV